MIFLRQKISKFFKNKFSFILFEKVGVSGETKIKVKRQKAICVCGITVRVKSIFKNNLSKTLIFKTWVTQQFMIVLPIQNPPTGFPVEGETGLAFSIFSTFCPILGRQFSNLNYSLHSLIIQLPSVLSGNRLLRAIWKASINKMVGLQDIKIPNQEHN